MNEYRLLSERFELFKTITQEENKITDLIRSSVSIDESSLVLDIGSNSGKISHAIQLNTKNITLVDVEEFDIKTGAQFLRGKWESLKLDMQFDIVIASHVWGHFYHDGTINRAFQKALDSTREGGKLILCYNTNNTILGELIDVGKKIFMDFQYDVFKESLFQGFIKKEIDFKISLNATDFEQLTDLIQVLLIVPDGIFESKRLDLQKHLKSRLSTPSFDINQKIVVIEKKYL